MRAVVIVLLAACGDDGLDANSCKPDGFSDGLGTVQGELLGPWVRAAQFPVGTMQAIAFDEVAGACGEVVPTGKHLVILMCEPPEEQNYRIVPRHAFRCPGAEAFAVIERDGGTDIASSLDGLLTIDSAEGCVRGSYAITLDTIDDIEGSFDALVCPN
jgi:hypothetical protein